MLKIICDKCEQEITDLKDVSNVMDGADASHYHKDGCFDEAREKLKKAKKSDSK